MYSGSWNAKPILVFVPQGVGAQPFAGATATVGAM